MIARLGFLLCFLAVAGDRLVVVAMITWRRTLWDHHHRHRVRSASAVCYQTVGKIVCEAKAGLTGANEGGGFEIVECTPNLPDMARNDRKVYRSYYSCRVLRRK